MTQTLENDPICRTCLSRNEDMTCIFSTHEFGQAGTRVCDFILLCASVQIHEGDGLPEQVCTRCICDMKSAFTFRKLCEKSDAVLRDKLKSTQNIEQHLKTEPQKNSENESDGVTNHIKLEFVDDTFYAEVTSSKETIPVVDPIESNINYNEALENVIDYNTSLNDTISEYNSDNKDEDEDVSSYGDDNLVKVEHGVSTDDRDPLGERMDSESGYAGKVEQNLCVTEDVKPQISKPVALQYLLCRVISPNRADSISVPQQQHSPSKKAKAKVDPKVFECEVCKKTFTRRLYLYQHCKLHTGIREFTCEHCNKSFRRKEHLLRHRMLHSGVKNFTCNICEKAFSRNDNLLKHKKTHGRERNFTCKICQMQFVMKHHYEAHKVMHEK